MGLPIYEAAKLGGVDIRATVVEMFARSSDILRTLPFKNIKGGAYKYNQESDLPGVAFRGVNESYTPSTGAVNPVMEPLVICGGELDVDAFIVATDGEEARSVQEMLKVKKIASTWQQKFIKGDQTSTPAEFDGLQRRLTGSQVVSNNTGSGGAALSLNKLDELIDAVDTPTHLLMSKAMKRRLTAAARNTSVGGHVNWDTDDFGRSIMKYADLPILIADPNGVADAALGFDEAYTGGGTANGTSIYCLSFGDGMLTGIQNEAGMDVRDLGEIDSPPVYRTRVEWYAGIALEHGRAAARLRDIADGAVTV